MSAVFSCLSLFVLLIAFLDNVVHANFSFRPPNSTCVWSERHLRKVIKAASNKIRTTITLCRKNISISTINPYNSTGIDITDRLIDLRCYLKRIKGSCTLDGMGSSRFFFGRYADLTVRNVRFINSKPSDFYNGGALFAYDSNIKFTGCSFIDNGNELFYYGGAINAFQSKIMINGGSMNMPVMFSHNEGEFGGALFVTDSEVSIDGYTVFYKNSGEEGAVYLEQKSTFNIKDVQFIENVGRYVSALSSPLSSNSTMKNVVFNGNVGGYLVIYLQYSSILATNCTFKNHRRTVIGASVSKITLENSTFSNNTLKSTEKGSNIYIYDDVDPLTYGTFVKCETDVVFCNGLSETSFYEYNFDKTIKSFSNTDCNTKGVQGKPGQGNCPL